MIVQHIRGLWHIHVYRQLPSKTERRQGDCDCDTRHGQLEYGPYGNFAYRAARLG